MLNRQRREKPLKAKAITEGKRVVQPALRRRRGHLHRRPRLHPPLRLPVAVGEEARRPAPRRPGGGDRRELRRLRQLRRGRRRRGALPLLLPHRAHLTTRLARPHRWRNFEPRSWATCNAAARRKRLGFADVLSDERRLARSADHDRRACDRRTGRRRHHRLADRAWRAERLVRAGDLGARRRAADRRHRLLSSR